MQELDAQIRSITELLPNDKDVTPFTPESMVQRLRNLVEEIPSLEKEVDLLHKRVEEIMSRIREVELLWRAPGTVRLISQ